jgi:hypothetical protein
VYLVDWTAFTQSCWGQQKYSARGVINIMSWLLM